jgi:hypothetical protein
MAGVPTANVTVGSGNQPFNLAGNWTRTGGVFERGTGTVTLYLEVLTNIVTASS